MIDSFIKLLESIEWFLKIVAADFVAILIWWLIKQWIDSNVSFIRRMQSWRFNCLAILYQEIREARLSNTPEANIQALMQEKFEKKTFAFMLHEPSSASQLEDLAFIKNLIDNQEALIRFAKTPSFGKKEYKDICYLLGCEEKLKEARNAIRSILKDKSKQSIDGALIWLPKLLTAPFIGDPNSAKTPGVVENTYTIFYLFKGKFFDENVAVEDYKKTISLLKQVYPDINISVSGHSSDWSNYTMESYPRGKALLDVIQNTLASSKT